MIRRLFCSSFLLLNIILVHAQHTLYYYDNMGNCISRTYKNISIESKSIQKKDNFSTFDLTKIEISPLPYVFDKINVNILSYDATIPLSYIVTNVSGQTELNGQSLKPTFSIYVSDLTLGLHILTISGQNIRESYKIIKK